MTVIGIEATPREIETIDVPSDLFSVKGNKDFIKWCSTFIKSTLANEKFNLGKLSSIVRANFIVSEMMKNYFIIYNDGTIITNDNKNYLVNGINSFISAGLPVKDIAEALRTSVCASKK